MRLLVQTIVLDGFPFLPLIHAELRKLVNIDWSWVVCEGVASPSACTRWCAQTPPRLSNDGTTQYLEALCKFDPRVIHHKKEQWAGKLAMLNEPLRYLHEPAVLLQIDSDEIWTAELITKIHSMLAQRGKKNCAYFYCRYFVGRNIVITSRDTYGNQASYEWHRAWRVEPGVRWQSHEPPKLVNFEERPFTHEETEKLGLVFDHFSWATEKQVEEKSRYYGSSNNREHGKDYADAVKNWKRLQENETWPADLQKFLPWVGEGVVSNRISP